MKKKKKRAVTLIEIMIVILLIGLIGGALAYNMRGSMDEGKIFKTKQNMSRVEDILNLAACEGEETEKEIASNWRKYVEISPLATKETAKDGWNKEFSVRYENEKFHVISKKLVEIEEERAKKFNTR